MGINTGNQSRIGAVKNRVQHYNAKTRKYVKRDTTTGKFMSNKETPFKGVRKKVKK